MARYVRSSVARPDIRVVLERSTSSRRGNLEGEWDSESAKIGGVRVLLLTYSSVGAMPSAYLIVLDRPLKVSTDLADNVPKRSSFSMSTNAVGILNQI